MNYKHEGPKDGRDERYWLGEPAAGLYERMKADRENVLEVAREMAVITIPSLFPPEGYKPGDTLGENNQSVGASCVNTLSSKLMYVAFPPDRPSMRYELEEYKLKKEQDRSMSPADKQKVISRINVALAALEVAHKRRSEATRLRMAYTTAMKQELVGGQLCWEHAEIGDPVVHRIDTYVVKRNSRGEQLFVILEESLLLEDLPEDFAERIYEEKKESFENKRPWECEVTIHRVCKKDGDDWLMWSEYLGEMIPESEDVDDLPQLYAAWLIPNYKEDWGRSYAEEYRGDHYIVENGYSALQDGMAAAARTIFGLKPGSSTKLNDLKNARNLKTISGDLENDVTTLRLDKGSDYAFVDTTTSKAERRLARAYLMMSSIQRDAERVTAEEWVRMASEIDEAMGGLHSVLAQTFQRHVIMKFLKLHRQEDSDLPNIENIAPGAIRTEVVTGIDALSRSHEAAALRRFRRAAIEDLGPEKAATLMNDSEYLRRLAQAEGVNTEGLVLDEEEVASNNQTGLTQQVAAQAAPGAIEKVVGAMADGGKEAFLNQQQQQPPNGVPTNGA